MNGNTESTTNSMKFEPMPMSVLLANIQQNHKSPNISFSGGQDSDSSFEDIVNYKPPTDTINNENIWTPIVKSDPKQFRAFVSENKLINDDSNKENIMTDRMLNQTNPDKGRYIQKPKGIQQQHSEKKNLILQNNNSRTNIVKKTPEISKVNNTLKIKSATPKIKVGIRRFTPGSASKRKKTPLKNDQQDRNRVRCELFQSGQNDSQVSQKLVPQPAHAFPTPVPETPINKKQMPVSYVATPSYPQGITGNNHSKVMFKTTNIKDKKYMFIKKLGIGGSSEVYKVLEVSTSCEYAVKCVYLAKDHELAQGYVNEVRLLRQLQKSDRVVRLYDYEYDRNSQLLRMVLEVGETDLSSILKARDAGLPPALVLHYWEEMLQAVAYIHEHGVIHADLKPANFILVCGRLKLIDFGISSAVSGDATSVVRAQATGTYSYISPEALMGGAGGYGGAATDDGAPIKISYRSDVWSLGCILYSMVYRRTPFAHIPNLAKLAVILNPNHNIDYPPVEHLPPSLIAALKWCLTYNARARPYVRDLLAIPYLKPSNTPLPQSLLEKLKPLVTPQEFIILLERAQV